jgi:hypothetical protein
MILIFAAGAFARGRFQVRPVGGGDWYLESIKVPEGIKVGRGARPVVIAIVDDGVRMTHRDVKDFIWVNSKEVAGNGIDDDGNGHIDDVHGWDVSDKDNDPTPPEKRLKTFYHGTHLAGVIAQIARSAYGDSAADYVKIMPVKALGDKAQRTYIKDGYKGVEYALKAGADVILCAWGVGHISDDDSKVLKRAVESRALVVASAGSFPEEQDQYPAAHDAVIAVAGLTRQNKKTEKSNFGGFVDISAPGIDISGADAGSDEGRVLREGSSQSAAMVAAAGAMVKVRHRSYSPEQIRACLKASAIDIARYNPRYPAKLGAGKLNVRGAIESRLFIDDTAADNRLVNPQGYLRFRSSKGKAFSWIIRPGGDFKGLRFRVISIEGDGGDSVLRFYQSASDDARALLIYRLGEPPGRFYVAGTEAKLIFEPKGADSQLEWLIEYRAEPIDFRTMYCSGTTELDEEGTFEDGSGEDNYAFHSDCKWLITAPEGKVVKITFSEFDTEPKTDLVYFFSGAGTHEKIMAVFSGPNIPPELTTWRNQVLVWFVTDGRNQGKGFKAKYEFVDP